MGCDITSFAEVRSQGKWQRVTEPIFPDYIGMSNEPYGWRNYHIFGFLADIMNRCECPPIAEARGLPDDSEWLNQISPYAYDVNPMSGEAIPPNEQLTERTELLAMPYFGYSWLTLKELLDFDYSKTFMDQQRQSEVTYRQHVGDSFFTHLHILSTLGSPEDVRIIFWFDI